MDLEKDCGFLNGNAPVADFYFFIPCTTGAQGKAMSKTGLKLNKKGNLNKTKYQGISILLSKESNSPFNPPKT